VGEAGGAAAPVKRARRHLTLFLVCLAAQATGILRNPGHRFRFEVRSTCHGGFPLPAFAGTGPAGMMVLLGVRRHRVALAQEVIRCATDPANRSHYFLSKEGRSSSTVGQGAEGCSLPAIRPTKRSSSVSITSSGS
jgi:hypothetical protein